jgi:hypothetical protein
MEDIFSELKALLTKVVSGRDVKSQETFLMIVFRVLIKLSLEHLEALLPVLSEHFAEHAYDRCRGLFIKICIWVYDNHDGFAELKTLHQNADLVKLILKSLLKGLSDSSEEIRNNLFEFWDSPNRLPQQITARLIGCLTDLYQPESESQWLRYCVFLLMQPSHHGVDFMRPISEHPLRECKFNRLSIDSAYRTRNVFTPMFSQSKSSQDEHIEEDEDVEMVKFMVFCLFFRFLLFGHFYH